MVYTVCVGVDGSAPSLDALKYALDDAVLRGGEVRVLTTWWPANSLPGTLEAESELFAEQAKRVQDTAVDSVLEGFDAPPMIHRRIARGVASEALVHHSRADDLLVVGSHHKGILKRFVEGSVSTYCIRHSRIPVTVVPRVDPALASLDSADTRY